MIAAALALGVDEVTERYTFNPSLRAEVIRRRDEIERDNARARLEYMLQHRAQLLGLMLWSVPENDWRKVGL